MSKKKGTQKARKTNVEQEAPNSATPLVNERLRQKGKWIFAALAVIFAVSFVVAGVGTGGPSLVDLFEAERAEEAVVEPADQALVNARAATEASPDDAAVWIALARAYVNADDTDEAVIAAAKAAELAPDDAGVQGDVADIYLAQAGAATTEAQRVYREIDGGGASLRPPVPTVVIIGQSSGGDAFRSAIESTENQRFQEALAAVQPLQVTIQEAYTNAVRAQEAAAAADPRSPAVWFRLGQIAGAAGDDAVALQAYRTFIELVPDDPLVTQVQEEIDRLEGAGQPQVIE